MYGMQRILARGFSASQNSGDTLHRRYNRVCYICGKIIINTKDLKRHIMTHTGEKPFECDICNRGFSLKANMERHRKRHSNAMLFVLS